MLGNAYVSLGEIITAAAQELRDTGFTHGLGRPFYASAAQRGLSEMNYATNFFKKVFIEKVPENLILDLPDDMTEKDQMYLFSGNTCNIGTSVMLFVKPNMWHGGGTGYLAQNKGRNYDNTQFSLAWSQAQPSHLYFCGERSGKLYLSESCRQYERIAIPYTGIGMDCFGEDFEVPMWAREAITDFVIHRVALAIEREDPQFMARVISRKEGELKGNGGSWQNAIWRYKRSDKKQRYETSIYNFDLGSYI